jgi:3-phenylpropionate/trans-cinnamate dioxygenase ferredoxin reductase subunit
MKGYKYLIVGGGMTADAAARGIRELDPQGSIGLVGAEADPPYARPPLSKGMWKGRALDKIWRGTDKLNVDLQLGRTITRLDPQSRSAIDDRGQEYSYEKLLLATGGSPPRLPFGNDHTIYFRTLGDYERLRALSDAGGRFLVIGAGFIGPEIAASLRAQDRSVTMVFRGEAIGARMYPRELSQHLNGYYRKKGVELVPGDAVTAINELGAGLEVRTERGGRYEVDGIVAGLGLRPNVELAVAAGLTVADGILVDDHMRSSNSDIYAAGDVAGFPDAALGKRVRVEHEDNALQTGRQAGRNMAGANEPYTRVGYFYSDLFELGYEAVGELNPALETFSDWSEPLAKGVIYYLDLGRVRGVLLWNVWDKREEAAALLAEPGPFTPANLKGRLAP